MPRWPTRLAGAALRARAAGAVRRAVAQARHAAATAAHETLIVITANNEAIRYEFGRAFRAHMARKGRNVEIDWRSPGGAAEIARTLASEYAASFERHWRDDLHRRWTARDRGRLLAAGVRCRDRRRSRTHGGHSSPPTSARASTWCSAAAARSSSDTRRRDGSSMRGSSTRHPELFGPGGIPAELGGETLWDRDGRWVGACLSSFGICYNRDALARLGVDGAADLLERAGRAAVPRPARARRSDQERDQRQGARDDRAAADDRRAPSASKRPA